MPESENGFQSLRKKAENALEERDEEALKQSEAMFRGLLNAFSDPLILFTQDRTVLWDNESAAFFFTLDPKPQTKSLCLEFFTKEIGALVNACFMTGQPGRCRVTIHDKVMDARTFPIVPQEKAEVSHVILTVTDVGKKLQHPEQTMQTARLAILGGLSASIAHEINNPNATILLNGPVLQDVWRSICPILHANHPPPGAFDFGALSYTEVIERVPELLSDITDCSRRIQRIVTHLKLLVRKENGGMNEAVDMVVLIGEVVALLHHKIQKSTHQLQMTFEQGIPKVSGNAQQLEQVVINLIMNALESLPDKASRVKIMLQSVRHGAYVMLMIEDEGCGMDSETMAHILEPLFTTRALLGGTGLGLAVSKKIIDRHQGTIRFESEVGKGSSVIVELPIFKNETPL